MPNWGQPERAERLPLDRRTGLGGPAEQAPPPARPISDASRIEETVLLLIQHDRRNHASKVAIGKHLFESYFGADESLVRSKSRTKLVTFSKLAKRAREATSWKKANLYEAVVLYLVTRSLPPEIAGAIKPTYLELLDTVEGEARTRLAERIAQGELRGDAAKKAIFEAAGHRRGGRHPRARVLAAAVDLERRGRRLRDSGTFDKAALQGIQPPEVLAEVLSLLEGHVATVRGLADAVRRTLAPRRGRERG